MNGALKARLLDLDQTWSRRLQTNSQTQLLRTLGNLFAHSGDSWFVLIALGLGWWLGNSDWKTLALTMDRGPGNRFGSDDHQAARAPRAPARRVG